MPKDRFKPAKRRLLIMEMIACFIMLFLAAFSLTAISIEIDIHNECEMKERASLRGMRIDGRITIGWPILCRANSRDRAWSLG